MSAIIAMLITELSKILIPALIEWIQGLFNRVSKGMQSTGDDAADAVALADRALAATPKIRVFKRALLRKVKEVAGDVATGKKLTAADKNEFEALAMKAQSE